MKFIRSLKIIDLLVTIFFIVLVIHKNLTVVRDSDILFGFGILLILFMKAPVVILLLISAALSFASIVVPKVLIPSIISQIVKISSFILNIVISKYLLEIRIKIDYMVIIPIYAVLVLIILISYKLLKVEKQKNISC